MNFRVAEARLREYGSRAFLERKVVHFEHSQILWLTALVVPLLGLFLGWAWRRRRERGLVSMAGPMKHRPVYLGEEDHVRVTAAVSAAEMHTSGEIVTISRVMMSLTVSMSVSATESA